MRSNEDFAAIMSMIGEHVLSIRVDRPDPFIIDAIKDVCINVRSMELWLSYEEPLQLPQFPNLKELKILFEVPVSTKELKSYLANNKQLECLEYFGWYDKDFFEVLDILPKLNSLELSNLQNVDYEHLFRYDGITRRVGKITINF